MTGRAAAEEKEVRHRMFQTYSRVQRGSQKACEQELEEQQEYRVQRALASQSVRFQELLQMHLLCFVILC